MMRKISHAVSDGHCSYLRVVWSDSQSVENPSDEILLRGEVIACDSVDRGQ